MRRSGMTQQYIAGELSVLLARLQAVANDDGAVGEVIHLWHEAETRPLWTLRGVEVRALELADGLCWDRLTRGDPATFDLVATIGAQLREFAVCSGLPLDH